MALPQLPPAEIDMEKVSQHYYQAQYASQHNWIVEAKFIGQQLKSYTTHWYCNRLAFVFGLDLNMLI